MPRDYVTKILRARVYEVARETPLERAPKLSARMDNEVWLKREDLQPIFTFKLRGAYNKLASLSDDERSRGVIAASAGNHAQGVALAARQLGVEALVVMPETAPRIKVEAVERLGAEVVLAGESYDGARERAEVLAAETGRVFVPPFDDVDVIAGQGTIAMEIVRQHSEPFDAVFVEVGGGGLIAGISAYIKTLWPHTRIVGVEPDDTPTLHASLAAGERVVLDHVGTFADGVAVKQIGVEPFRIARECVDEVVLVTDDEICAAIKDVFEDTRSIAEPAGALAVAGLKRYVEREGVVGLRFAAIVSGANVNFDRLRHIAERAELGEHRESLLAVTIPERPGSLLRFCEILGRRAITEFNYRYADEAQAHIFVGVEIGDAHGDRAGLLDTLAQDSYPVLDLSDDEMAKQHVRYMVGGRASRAIDEVLYRFDFPGVPARSPTSSPAWGAGRGTSACSTTATTARRTAACSWACRCRPPTAPLSWRSWTTWATTTGKRRRIRPTGCSCGRGRACPVPARPTGRVAVSLARNCALTARFRDFGDGRPQGSPLQCRFRT